MKKCIIFVLFLVLLFSGCDSSRLDENDVIGLTSAEIVAKYGDFDRKQGSPAADGLYRSCACGYLTKEATRGFFGTTPEEYFMIYFDDNGIAHWSRIEAIV